MVVPRPMVTRSAAPVSMSAMITSSPFAPSVFQIPPAPERPRNAGVDVVSTVATESFWTVTTSSRASSAARCSAVSFAANPLKA
jgi:hypothetical protein